MKSAMKAINKIRVMIADDHPVVLQGLTAILRSAKDIKVVAEATDGEQTCQLYDQLSRCSDARSSDADEGWTGSCC